MAVEVSVTTDPLIVYGMVGLLVGAVALALIFSRPRRGLGAIKRSDVPGGAPSDEPWMPGGDIFGRDREPQAALPTVAAPPTVTALPSDAAATDPATAVPDPWANVSSDPASELPPWGEP